MATFSVKLKNYKLCTVVSNIETEIFFKMDRILQIKYKDDTGEVFEEMGQLKNRGKESIRIWTSLYLSKMSIRLLRSECSANGRSANSASNIDRFYNISEYITGLKIMV